MPAEVAENREETPRPARQNAAPQQTQIPRAQTPQPANDNAEPRRTIDERIGDTMAGLRDKWRSVIRYDDPGDAPQGNLLLPPTGPIRAVGNYIDGAVLTSVRTATDIISPIGTAARAAYRTVTRPVFHPVDTLKRPGNYLANPMQTIGSSTRAAANYITRIPRSLEERANRLLKRVLQNLSKIPLATTASKVFGFLGKGLDLVSKGAEKLKDKTIGNLCDWLATKQC